MPDTYPGIVFDEKEICIHCRTFKKEKPLGEAAFLERLRLKTDSPYDCVLGISGGKDSSYVAYLAKKKFGLRPLAVSYDFAFMVDLARNNIKAVCTSLGIELSVVKSRNNLEYNHIRNHLISLSDTATTWGQCVFCHYGIEAILYKIAREKKIPFILSGETSSELWWNPGNRTKILLNRIRKLPAKEKIAFGINQFRAYCGLVDQRRQFPIPGNSRYNVYKRARLPKNGPEIIRVFDYLQWDQHIIEKTLREETGWEKPPKTLTWRYDCILEPLLDYTYKKEFGISSAGLYLCGLIREGLVQREEALGMLKEAEDQAKLDASMKKVLDFLKIPLPIQKKFFPIS
jgi:hypothetical protein